MNIHILTSKNKYNDRKDFCFFNDISSDKSWKKEWQICSVLIITGLEKNIKKIKYKRRTENPSVAIIKWQYLKIYLK